MSDEATCSENHSADEFLIAQFQTLINHIDALFNAATQRIASYLVFASLVFAGLQIAQRQFQNPFYLAVGYLGISMVGWIVWLSTVYCRKTALSYFRTTNRIRAYFHSRLPDIEKLCAPLPVTDEKPKWDDPVFDPGRWIVGVVVSLTLAGFVHSLLLLFSRLHSEYAGVLSVLAFLVSLCVLLLLERRIMKTEGDGQHGQEHHPAAS